MVLLVCTSTYGWGRREHAVVAKIAEDHLTPKAKEYLHKYMHRRSLVYYSCYADDYQPLYIDLGWQPSNYRRMAMFPHTYSVDGDCKPYRYIRKGDEYLKNCLYYIDTWSKELKKSHKKMNDSVRLTHLALIVHAVGDMHCPMHAGHKSDRGGNGTQVTYFGKSRNLHSVWDSEIVESAHKWSYTEWQRQIDRLSRKECRAIVQGSSNDWIEECVAIADDVYRNSTGTNLSYDYVAQYASVVEQQLLKGGLRLAALIEEIY